MNRNTGAESIGGSRTQQAPCPGSSARKRLQGGAATGRNRWGQVSPARHRRRTVNTESEADAQAHAIQREAHLHVFLVAAPALVDEGRAGDGDGGPGGG